MLAFLFCPEVIARDIKHLEVANANKAYATVPQARLL